MTEIIAIIKHLAAPPIAPIDLYAHNCINLRFGSGALHPWAFEKKRKSLEITVDGSLTVNDGNLALRAVLDGVGIARLTDKLNGEIVDTRQYMLSSDLKTLTLTIRKTGTRPPSVLVFER